MKTKSYLIILAVLSLLIAGCTQKQEPQPVFQQPQEQDKVIISLDKINDVSNVEEKYEIYFSGKYTKTLTNNNKQDTKSNGQLLQSDLDYLKSLVINKEFNSIPSYMEGAGENCPVIKLNVEIPDSRLIRTESCANTPEAFNKVIDAIEKLK